MHGLAGHWDEWYRHVASEDDRSAIAAIGRSEHAQSALIDWISSAWTNEVESRDHAEVPRFVLAQLAHVPPFDRWYAFAPFRTGYGCATISAVVVAEQSQGEASDVRRLEAVLLPPDPDTSASRVVGDGFCAESTDLEAARQASIGTLKGRGLAILLALWLVGGRRGYSRITNTAVTVGWLAAVGLIVRLLWGPEPGASLEGIVAVLSGLVGALLLTQGTLLGRECWRTWRRGRRLAGRLVHGQVRLSMSGGLTVKGASAGLPFCLGMLLAAYRSEKDASSDAGLWRHVLELTDTAVARWAASGTVTPTGAVRPVLVDAKVRACSRHESISNLLLPWRHSHALKQVASPRSDASGRVPHGIEAAAVEPSVGFAADSDTLRIHRCGHVAHALMTLGGLWSWRQLGMNIVAVLVMATVGAAGPDLLAILRPPPAPAVVTPGSPSPYYLWVSIDAESPRHFRAVLESEFWSNRRVDFERYGGARGGVRAELALRRASHQVYDREDEGVVWIERRRRFLGREYVSGERVGRYHVSYLNSLGYE
ncbi:MAG: hypothetical protein IAE82_11965 [Opitutaceae bacterium]|nr:hypothetical protein [Opitutaceae bacterium]